MPACQIAELDPFDKSVAKYFNYEPYGSCAKWVSPFEIRPPNRFQMKKNYVSKYKASCSYNIIEGRKDKEENEVEKEGPTVKFETKNEVVVNASVVRVECKSSSNNKCEFRV